MVTRLLAWWGMLTRDTGPSWLLRSPSLKSLRLAAPFPLLNLLAGQPYFDLFKCLSMSHLLEKACSNMVIITRLTTGCGSHLAAGRTLVSAPVYVTVVLQTARVLEQLPALVTRISASSSPAGVESLAHAIWNINNYNQPPPPLFYAWQNTNNQLKWETLGSTFTPTCFKLLFFIPSLNTASLATS